MGCPSRPNSVIYLTSCPSLLDSSFRWNDYGEGCRRAFAGMTAKTGTSRRGCPEPPGENRNPSPPSFRRRPACMDAGGRAASGTKAEESSGLFNTFPHSGNDHMAYPSRPNSVIYLTSCPALLDSSFRWNDYGEGCRRVFAEMTAKTGTSHRGCPEPPGENRNPSPPSFRRRPESSGLFNTYPHSGNDHARLIPQDQIA